MTERLERDLAWGLIGAVWGVAFYNAKEAAQSSNPTVRRAGKTKKAILLLVAAPFFFLFILIPVLCVVCFVGIRVWQNPILLVPLGIASWVVWIYRCANKNIARGRSRGAEVVCSYDPDDGYWPGPETAEERCFRLNNERARRQV